MSDKEREIAAVICNLVIQDSKKGLEMKTKKRISERGFERRLKRLLERVIKQGRIRTFEEAGILTYNRGLVVKFADGQEFQVTIVKNGR